MARFQTDIRELVLAAADAGDLYLVNEHGTRYDVASDELLSIGQCWAHIRDHNDGRWYVQELGAAAELCSLPLARFFEPFHAHFTHGA